MKKLLLLSALATGLFCSVAASAAAPVVENSASKAPATATAQCDEPKNFIDSLNNKVISTITDSKLSDDRKSEILADMFHNYVNIKWIGQFVLGQHWRALTPAQQADYLQAYDDYLIATYVPIFKDYKGEKIELISATPLKRPAEYMVATKIIRTDEPEVQVSYRIKKDAACFQVYDMVAEGVSMLNTQRQDFGSIYSRKGYDELIKLLKGKVTAKPTEKAEKTSTK